MTLREVKEFMYLSFLFLKNREVDNRLKKRIRGANVVMRQFCGLRNILFVDDFRSRMNFSTH